MTASRSAAIALAVSMVVLCASPVRSYASTASLLRDTIDDLLQLETAPQTLPAEARVVRLQRGIEALQRARMTGDSDPAHGAAVLFRLRVLEAQSAAWERWSEGVEWALEADSLAPLLNLQIDASTTEDAILALAAGHVPSRRDLQIWTARLYEHWRRRWFAPDSVVLDARDVLCFQWLAQRDGRVLDDATQRAPLAAIDSTLAALARTALAGSSTLIAADDPGRRLELAVRALAADGAIASRWIATASRAADFSERTAAAHRTRMQALDSLQAPLAATHERATPILGTRHDYYRKPGTTGPGRSTVAETRARFLGERALAALRLAAGDLALATTGILAQVAAEPAEIVPNQSTAYVWTLASARRFVPFDARVRIGRAAVPIEAISDTNDTRIVRTRFVAIGAARAGMVRSPQVELILTLPEWGEIEIADRAPVHVVAPIQASLMPVGDHLVHGSAKQVEVIVTSRAPEPLQGTIRVVAPTDFQIAPARSFQFDLRRPGQSARALLELEWATSASPGTYDVAVKLEVGRENIGTIRTQLVRPMQWVIAGPFAPPEGAGALQPEAGVDLEARFDGMDGNQTTWQAVPPEGFDADGALDLEALFPEVAAPACAVAFTVIESSIEGPALFRVEGASRVRWNGRQVGADGRVRVERGRNTLLARTTAAADGWRLRAALLASDGEPLRVLANDLTRLLDGYDRLGRAAWRSPSRQPTDRLVTLRYRTGPASEVAVLGVFNAWVPQTLARQADGTWARDLRLMPGRYAYKLLVDGRLRPDPEAPASEPDGFGGHNSLLIVR